MTPRKKEISPENVGQAFFDGPKYYKLVDCQTEPFATFAPLDQPDERQTGPVSKFEKMVLLRPIREVKAPRSDKGKTHRKASGEELQNQAQVGDD